MAEARHSPTFSGNSRSLRAAARPEGGQRLPPAPFNGCQLPGDVAGEESYAGEGVKDGGRCLKTRGERGIPYGGDAARPRGQTAEGTPGPAAGRAGTHRWAAACSPSFPKLGGGRRSRGSLRRLG